ncbi:MAG: F0F1 ATP synthase subunit B [Clostridia bacterium]|nr:F0F1 ATP synthase subunit B [Clostridia bacterium]MBQ7845570.1 F0F1 ATP synthase subunit B [Clostridia bacterium]MBQ7865520.1 F0F1 ATP synthase subunit B [Clostridia bacterium]
MQSLEVISINLWDVLISLANLAILFVLIKKFLYKPVKKVIAARQEAIAKEYAEAEAARTSAEASRTEYAQKLSGAQDEVDAMLEEATMNANRRGERIVADAQDKADGIIRQAQTEAEMEKKKAQATIRREITDVSAALTEKLLGREMSADDHRAMIDSFLDGIGEEQ